MATRILQLEKLIAGNRMTTAGVTLVSGDDYLIPNRHGEARLLLDNTDTNDRDITINAMGDIDGLGFSSRNWTLVGETSYLLGGFTPAIWNDDKGVLHLTTLSSDIKLVAFAIREGE